MIILLLPFPYNLHFFQFITNSYQNGFLYLYLQVNNTPLCCGLTYTIRYISTLPSLELHFGHRDPKLCLKDLFDFSCELDSWKEMLKIYHIKQKKQKTMRSYNHCVSEGVACLPTVLPSSSTNSTVRCLYSTLKFSIRD